MGRGAAVSRARWLLAVGQRLAAARARAGLTLASAATRSGLRLNSISRWELGRQCPSAYDLARYCSAIGAQVALVLPSEPPESPPPPRHGPGRTDHDPHSPE